MIKIIKCPCCGNKIKLNIKTKSRGTSVTFLVETNIDHSPTVCELSEMGIELGITDEEVKNKDEC